MSDAPVKLLDAYLKSEECCLELEAQLARRRDENGDLQSKLDSALKKNEEMKRTGAELELQLQLIRNVLVDDSTNAIVYTLSDSQRKQLGFLCNRSGSTDDEESSYSDYMMNGSAEAETSTGNTSSSSSSGLKMLLKQVKNIENRRPVFTTGVDSRAEVDLNNFCLDDTLGRVKRVIDRFSANTCDQCRLHGHGGKPGPAGHNNSGRVRRPDGPYGTWTPRYAAYLAQPPQQYTWCYSMLRSLSDMRRIISSDFRLGSKFGSELEKFVRGYSREPKYQEEIKSFVRRREESRSSFPPLTSVGDLSHSPNMYVTWAYSITGSLAQLRNLLSTEFREGSVLHLKLEKFVGCRLESLPSTPRKCAATPPVESCQLAAVSPRVPLLIFYTVEEIERRGLTEEGLYRVCGSLPEVLELKAQFRDGTEPELLNVVDIHALCSLMKYVLRKCLSEPILTYKLRPEFVRASMSDGETGIKEAINKLPGANRDTLVYMMLHLQRVTDSPDTLMSVEGIVRAIAPSIVRYSSPDPDVSELQLASKVHEAVLTKLLGLSSQYYRKLADNAIRVDRGDASVLELNMKTEEADKLPKPPASIPTPPTKAKKRKRRLRVSLGLGRPKPA